MVSRGLVQNSDNCLLTVTGNRTDPRNSFLGTSGNHSIQARKHQFWLQTGSPADPLQRVVQQQPPGQPLPDELVRSNVVPFVYFWSLKLCILLFCLFLILLSVQLFLAQKNINITKHVTHLNIVHHCSLVSSPNAHVTCFQTSPKRLTI